MGDKDRGDRSWWVDWTKREDDLRGGGLKRDSKVGSSQGRNDMQAAPDGSSSTYRGAIRAFRSTGGPTSGF